jgi:hypothetical protein
MKYVDLPNLLKLRVLGYAQAGRAVRKGGTAKAQRTRRGVIFVLIVEEGFRIRDRIKP